MAIFRAVDIHGDLELSADVVIIGSGAGGAVAAHELAKAGRKVIVLEKGAYKLTSDFHSDPRWAMDNLYAGGGVTAALGLPPVIIPYGECVGGTTVINSGTVFRIRDHVFERWQKKFAVEAASATELAPFYKYVEEKIGATESQWPALGEMNRLLDAGVKKLGLSGGPLVRNAPHCAGCGMCVFGCPSGAKQSMLVTFIPAADALGATLYAECTVDEILVEQGRAAGVRGRIVAREGGKVHGAIIVRAPVVVLAAGTFASPLLLDKSGIADESGARGRNLTIHPSGAAHARMPNDVQGWKAIPQGYHVSEWENQGIMLEGGFGPPEVLGLVVPGYGRAYQERMADYRKMMSFGVMVADDDSDGSVHSVAGQTVIRYQLGPQDKARLLFGWKKVIEILFAAGATEVYSGISGFDIVKRPEELAAIDPKGVEAINLTLSAYHPMGTCRMGSDKKRAVVDSYLETHAVRGLFVADGSVFPTALGVNPQASIMAFAARTADYIVRNHTRYF